MELTGLSFIGSQRGSRHGSSFQAFAPHTGDPLQPVFRSATLEELDRAAHLAAEAFASYAQSSGKTRAAFLRRIADSFESHREELAQRAHLETALPMPRLLGEVTRTANQVRMFAGVVEEGSWVQARIDPGLPDRTPLPRPDLRSMLRPLGPVAGFGASNFPLAFSVGGGDTASALAAGCPVIVKAHPAHPGTSELAAAIIRDAVIGLALHPGVFSMLFDSGIDIGAALVQHPLIRAVAFTGSLRAGRALMDLAAARPDPIPCFTEMSSGNPVFILPGALRKGPAALAQSLFGSFTLGAGQFCTKPGIVLRCAKHPRVWHFETNSNPLSSRRTRSHFLPAGSLANTFGQPARARRPGFTLSAQAATSCQKETGPSHSTARAKAIHQPRSGISLRDWARRQSDLADEIFGPDTLLVTGDAVLHRTTSRQPAHYPATSPPPSSAMTTTSQPTASL